MDDTRAHMHCRRSMEPLPGPLPEFIFPPESHLLVTTSSAIYSKDSSSVQTIFKSSKGGIVSAKESTDGTGLLAVADGYIVVLRKKGDIVRRHRLKSVDGQLGVLSFANNSKELIFSTALQTSLRCYSIAQNQILDFQCTHPSPPTALAVSVNSTYIVSASPSPPVVYLQDLTGARRKVKFRPKQSNSPVTVASFHPERNEIFLLAYADGTLSVHTASRIILLRSAGSDGCLGHLKRAHRLTSTHAKRRERRQPAHQRSSSDSVTVGERSVGVTAATFISGYKLRTISVAGDGKCRVVDFEKGTNLIRCWSVQAACASLAVYTYNANKTLPKTEVLFDREQFQSSADNVLGLPNDAEPYYIVAVGRIDGTLLIFDAAGLLRSIERVDRRHRSLVDLAWIPEPQGDFGTKSEKFDVIEPTNVANIHWTFGKISASPQAQVNNRSSSMQTRSTPKIFKRGSTGTQDRIKGNPNTGQENEFLSPSINSLPQEQNKAFYSPPRLLDALKQAAFRPSLAPVETSRNSNTRAQVSGQETTELSPAVSEANSGNSYPVGPGSVALHDPRVPESLRKKVKREPKRRRMPGSWLEGSSSAETVVSPGKSKREVTPGYQANSGHQCYSQSPKSPQKNLSSLKPARHLRRASGLPTATALAKKMLSGSQGKSESTVPADTDSEDLSQPLASEDETRRASLRKQRDANPAFLALYKASNPLRLLTEPFEDNSRPEFAASCEYTCADVIREEMALVRAEIAALRKGLWVFGSRVEMSGSASNGIEEWTALRRATASSKPGEEPTFSE